MESTWTIRVNERSFGPYTLEQMRVFTTEGRLAPHSLVARGRGSDYRMAAEDAELATLFRPAAIPQAPRPVFFTAEGDIGQSQKRDAEASQFSRFLVLADMKSRSIAGLEEEIFRFGRAVPLMPQAWLLITDQSLNAVRNCLIQKLGRIDTLFVVDIARNKAAWSGYGLEADSRIRRVWQEAIKQTAAE
ncbi:hypothetical protein FHS83_003432 [Rhizomicrobium palustre]|uniref:GYF domain-containing protein n=1 Tax=Rhizomicrobium palustre TaxID=189966 RepID=A0A846N299_9PROT|nr:DUF4339 domain-containing protein [Rhizomicrobium palustre]NIK90114.1 hypothetical protein [Rhizomicrobium palustre]